MQRQGLLRPAGRSAAPRAIKRCGDPGRTRAAAIRSRKRRWPAAAGAIRQRRPRVVPGGAGEHGRLELSSTAGSRRCAARLDISRSAPSGRTMPAATAAASPATGLARTHMVQQARLVATVLGIGWWRKEAPNALRRVDRPPKVESTHRPSPIGDTRPAARLNPPGAIKAVATDQAWCPRWAKASRRPRSPAGSSKQGEAVAADEPLVELETDKVSVEVTAPAAGTADLEIAVPEGGEVEVGSPCSACWKPKASAPANGPYRPRSPTARQPPARRPKVGRHRNPPRRPGPASGRQSRGRPGVNRAAGCQSGAGVNPPPRPHRPRWRRMPRDTQPHAPAAARHPCRTFHGRPLPSCIEEQQGLAPAASADRQRQGWPHHQGRRAGLSWAARRRPPPAHGRSAADAPRAEDEPREERVKMTRLRRTIAAAAEGGAEHRSHADHLQRGGHDGDRWRCAAQYREAFEKQHPGVAARLHERCSSAACCRRAEGVSRRQRRGRRRRRSSTRATSTWASPSAARAVWWCCGGARRRPYLELRRASSAPSPISAAARATAH